MQESVKVFNDWVSNTLEQQSAKQGYVMQHNQADIAKLSIVSELMQEYGEGAPLGYVYAQILNKEK